MFGKYNPKELRIYTLAMLEALDSARDDEWIHLWAELQKFDQFLQRESANRRAAEREARIVKRGVCE